ncbi:MAG TPA: adenylate/guanylate cyclase domain-containing protein [Devosiaceae bacterium]|nr:adenylate/guanylate cyclase domain-containing protein [Devosiaceae bacterium]
MATCPNCGFGNSDTARFCSNCGNPLDATRPIEGERRFATVLFADVARSTAIAERLDPEDWALVMNGAFGFMNAAVSRYGGTVSRLMGDAILALFGAPIAHEDDAERAVRAGLEIQAMAVDHAGAIRQRYGVDFELRVGINTGTAVLAFVGDAVKTEYTAMGDAANVAARLQSAATPGSVLISADTYRLVHAVFDVRPLGPLEMKGKGAPIEAYEVTGIRAVPGQSRGLQGLSSALVGRDREFEVLRTALADLGKGRGAVVAVVGEAGLGKSRLIAELRKLYDDAADARAAWLETRAISYGQSIPYYPWRALGRQIIGATEMDGAAEVRDKLAAWIKRLNLKDKDLPFYETMLAVDDAASRAALASLPGDAVVDGVAAAVINALKSAMSAGGGAAPRVLVLDDLHWSDSASIELIAQVATLTAFEPLLLICALRPDRRAAAWGLIDRLSASLGSSFRRIDLEPLDAGATQQLLGNLLMVEDMPESVRDRILARSEGNPFYLEEVLRSLIDSGHVTQQDGRWRVAGTIEEASIPETLAGVLGARIDRLPETTKRVAQTAAVIGRVFQHRVLESVCRVAPDHIEHVEPHLATLSYEQLVREKAREPEREFIFKHALTCEAAYSLLLKSRRREMHALVGNVLENLFADRREEYAAVLAHHFSEAEDLSRALSYARAAAASARRLYALREEMEQRQRIVAVLERMPDAEPRAMIDALTDWAWVKLRLAEYDGVQAALERAVSIAREIDDKAKLATALSWLANYEMSTGFPSRSVPYLLESTELAKSLGNEQLLLLPLFFGTWSLVDRDPAEAIPQLDEIIALSKKYDAIDIEGHAMSYRAVALARTGDFAAAREQIEEALEVEKRTVSPVKRADIHIAVGMAYHDMGQLDLGLYHAQEGARLATDAHGFECACAGHFGVGRVQLDRGQYDAALSEFAQSLEFAGTAGFEGFINVIKGGQAFAEFSKVGGSTAALERLRVARDNARSLNDEYATAVLSQQLADLYLQLGRHAEAEEALEAANKYYEGAGMRPYLANGLQLRARILEAAGRSAEAEAVRQQAEALSAADVITLAKPPTSLSPANA